MINIQYSDVKISNGFDRAQSRYIISLGLKIILLLLLLSVCIPVESNTKPTVKDIYFAVGFSLEPYVLHNGGGIISEILNESFHKSGYRIHYKYLSNKNALIEFNEKKVDGLVLVRPNMVDAYLSSIIATFHNKVISIKKYNIHRLADLISMKVIAFSNAKQYLGAAFDEVSNKIIVYKEVAKQTYQVESLFNGKADVIIADELIFNFYLRKNRNYTLSRIYKKNVTVYDLLPPSNYHAAFHNKTHRDDFNAGFAQLKNEGRTSQIFLKYKKLLLSY